MLRLSDCRSALASERMGQEFRSCRSQELQKGLKSAGQNSEARKSWSFKNAAAQEDEN